MISLNNKCGDFSVIKMQKIKAEKLHEIGVRILTSHGVTKDDAKSVMDDLIQNDLMGDSVHGIVHLKNYVSAIKEGKYNIKESPIIVHETNTTAVIDGNGQMGQVVAEMGMKLAIKKAKKNYLGAVGLRHCNYVNRLGALSQMALKEGMIGIVFANAGPSGGQVAPFGGKKAMIGTNPISAAVPAEKNFPFLMDFATSVVAWNKIMQARKAGRKIPSGWIIDKDGKDTDDPNDFFAGGAILPAGAHKGYALGLLVEMLGGILTGSDTTIGKNWVEGNGCLLLVINIEGFMPKDEFLKGVDEFMSQIKETPPQAGFNKVLIPGEIEYTPIEERTSQGIPVNDDTMLTLTEMAKESKLDIDKILKQ